MGKFTKVLIRILYHNSIYKCNIGRYHKVKENHSYKGLARTFIRTKKLDFLAYDKMTDELIDEFGVTEEARRIFYLKRNRLRLICRYYIEQDRALIGKVAFKNRELEDALLKQKSLLKDDVKKVHSRSYRILGTWCNNHAIKKLTVFEFYNYMKDYEEEQSQKAA